LSFAVRLCTREGRESGGVESGKAALNTPISYLLAAGEMDRQEKLNRYQAYNPSEVLSTDLWERR
jgi:hypothetical protein